MNPMVAISYAHGRRDDEIVALSDRLRHDGVDCEIDAYDDTPINDWGRWMVDMMTRRVVLVVPSEAYYRRFRLEEVAGVGTGATFESGLLVQRAIESAGANHNIIPVLVDNADAEFIPEFLRGAPRYDLGEPDGYEKLLRRLTSQPAHPKPPLGPIPMLPPRSASNVPKSSNSHDQQVVLFRSEDSGIFPVPFSEIHRNAGILRIATLPKDHADTARLRGLRGEKHPFAVTFGSTACFAKIKDIQETIKDGKEHVDLEILEQSFDSGFGTEMSYNGISADEIAETRARRILLDERLQARDGTAMVDRLNDQMFESFVSGSSSIANRLVAKKSPIPVLAASMDPTSSEFLTVARLMCVMLLVLTGAIERVVRLTLTPKPDGVEVDFEGIRHKAYANCEATRIVVTGICPIGKSATA